MTMLFPHPAGPIITEGEFENLDAFFWFSLSVISDINFIGGLNISMRSMGFDSEKAKAASG